MAVVERLAAGTTHTKEVARDLDIPELTLRRHLRNFVGRLEAADAELDR
jgi:DNA-binding NarL/FixJ family response regulator